MLVVVIGALAARDLFAARRDIERANAVLAQTATTPDELTSKPQRAAAAERIDHALAELVRARRKLGGSLALRLVSVAPGLGYQRAGLLQLVDDAHDAAAAGRSLLTTAQRLEEAPVAAGTVPVASLATTQAELDGAARELRRVHRGVRGLWGPLASGRRRLDAASGPLAIRLQSAADVVGALRGFAGEGGARRYLVFGANNAEMRDQGEYLSFAVIRLDAGRLVVERTDPIERIGLAAPAPIQIPDGTASVFGALKPTTTWQSVNATADSTFTARAAVAMFKQATGITVEGVIVVDVPALAALLGVVGPVDVPLPAPVPPQGKIPRVAPVAASKALSEATAPAYLLSEQYDGLAPGSAQQARREAVSGVVDAVARRSRGSILLRFGPPTRWTLSQRRNTSK